MKHFTPTTSRFSALKLWGLMGLLGLMIAPVSLARKPTIKIETEGEIKTETKKDESPAPPTSRIFLTNGDRLRGEAQSIDAHGNLLFDAESLRDLVAFPIDNVLSLNLDDWKEQKRPDTLARVKLQPRFSENNSDVILGTLDELTPESIKLNTWYGGVITLKRSMVQSLRIINNSPGSFFGPNNLSEWTLSGGKGTWQFHNGALVSRANGGIGRDVGLTEKSHISFDVTWTKSMRFHLLIYSSDITKNRPAAYYDLNLSSYMSLRTVGKIAKGRQQFGGGRGQGVQLPQDIDRSHIDIYANRKTGTFMVYMDGDRVCLLQSTRPDPENLGTGLSFIAEERYPIEISGITVTPWNGTSLPNQIQSIDPDLANDQDSEDADPEADEDKKNDTPPKKAPHKIILNNGDEVPGTVGKVQDGKMIIETEYTPIEIPIKYIESLSLGDIGEQPKKYKGDVRAWFHQGGHITLKLISIKDGKIRGSSQAVGDVTISLAAFNRIDFHIYNKKANKLRKEMK